VQVYALKNAGLLDERSLAMTGGKDGRDIPAR
jgi:hypothetical protein